MLRAGFTEVFVTGMLTRWMRVQGGVAAHVRVAAAQARLTQSKGPDGKFHMLAIAGDRSTTSSIRRNDGMMRAVAEAPDVILDQTIFASWSREKAAEQSEVLFERYSAARMVWAS